MDFVYFRRQYRGTYQTAGRSEKGRAFTCISALCVYASVCLYVLQGVARFLILNSSMEFT